MSKHKDYSCYVEIANNWPNATHIDYVVEDSREIPESFIIVRNAYVGEGCRMQLMLFDVSLDDCITKTWHPNHQKYQENLHNLFWREVTRRSDIVESPIPKLQTA